MRNTPSLILFFILFMCFSAGCDTDDILDVGATPAGGGGFEAGDPTFFCKIDGQDFQPPGEAFVASVPNTGATGLTVGAAGFVNNQFGAADNVNITITSLSTSAFVLQDTIISSTISFPFTQVIGIYTYSPIQDAQLSATSADGEQSNAWIYITEIDSIAGTWSAHFGFTAYESDSVQYAITEGAFADVAY